MADSESTPTTAETLRSDIEVAIFRGDRNAAVRAALSAVREGEISAAPTTQGG